MSRAKSVAVAIATFDGNILLIERVRGAYPGLLALPGGKIECNEHVSNAILRELKEETGLNCDFRSHLGVVSELYYEMDQLIDHFVLHVCEILVHSQKVASMSEGKVEWFNLSTLSQNRDSMVPSDYKIIQNLFIARKEKLYWECAMRKFAPLGYEIIYFH